MTTSIEIEGMTTHEKLRLLEVVWQDLNRDPDSIPAPAWHGKELEEREDRLRRGESRLNDWPDAKRRIREQASR